MLVLARRLGEDVYIDCPDGVRIVIRVADLDKQRVRIGIDAPKDYIIHRAELLERPATKETT